MEPPMTPNAPLDGSTESDDVVLPVCRPTMERLQAVLDGELPGAALDADPHPAACSVCRGRIAAARLLLSVLAKPEPVTVPPGMAERIVAAMGEDRLARIRRRTFVFAGGIAVAIAASILFMGWLSPPPAIEDMANIRPAPVVPNPAAAPLGKPLRIGDELAKAGHALRDAPRAITDPASAAPQLFAMVGDALTRPAPAGEIDTPRPALSEIPDAARTSLEPVTGTAQKAFARLMHDVAGMKPKS
jgi:hypothetical protein